MFLLYEAIPESSPIESIELHSLNGCYILPTNLAINNFSALDSLNSIAFDILVREELLREFFRLPHDIQGHNSLRCYSYCYYSTNFIYIRILPVLTAIIVNSGSDF